MSFSLCFFRGRALLVGFSEQFSIPFSVALRLRSRKNAAGIKNSLVNLFEQGRHLSGPLLFVLLKGALQFPEMVSGAPGMKFAVLKIGLPMVVTEDAVKRREYHP